MTGWLDCLPGHCSLTCSTPWMRPGTGLFQFLNLVRVAKINGVVVSTDASSFPYASRDHPILFLKSYDFMGMNSMPQTCMLDFIGICYLPDGFSLTAVWLVGSLEPGFSLSQHQEAELLTCFRQCLHCSGAMAACARLAWLCSREDEMVVFSLFQCLPGQDYAIDEKWVCVLDLLFSKCFLLLYLRTLTPVFLQ